MSSTFKSLLGRLNTAERIESLPTRLQAVLNTYDDANTTLHPQFRDDMLGFLASAIELADLMSQPEYDANQVIRHGFTIMSVIPGFIRQAEDSKLSVIQHAIQHRITRARIPQIFASETEAQTYLNSMTAMLDTSDLEVIPIRVSTVTGAPPMKGLPDRAPPISPPSDPIPPESVRSLEEAVSASTPTAPAQENKQ